MLDRNEAAFLRSIAEEGDDNAGRLVFADWLEEHSARNPNLDSWDFLLLDPPRMGAESRVIFGIVKARPKRICYVSCDPATLARDLKKLIAGGYAIEKIAAFDMFPQTHHVETVVQMTC